MLLQACKDSVAVLNNRVDKAVEDEDYDTADMLSLQIERLNKEKESLQAELEDAQDSDQQAEQEQASYQPIVLPIAVN
jgi:FtsZ-binding cell division protein ZapB